MTNKLPTYFKKYLDTKFDTVLYKLDEVKTDVGELKIATKSNSKKITNLNGKYKWIMGFSAGVSAVITILYNLIKN